MKELIIKNSSFEEDVLNSDIPILVDFWAEWCGPCKMLSPVLAEIAEENDAFKIGKVNVDKDPSLAQKYLITNIPCLILFKDGKEVNRMVGLHSKEEVLEFIQK
ncbi:thioredoxin [Lachnobacterium bovis]|uniref:Thioredoxin n=1 Tax=Lachnobacterium bovis DSM 14045 TaxID=1122142 RepID=A0A1H3H9L2_9FIRM|nr:thioredoxin [Lachnobacterium bovis]SDY11905.1 thioredoxin [Lachnobacterium bovis DSM 14045]